MTEALVTPALMTWARERKALDFDALAPKISVRPESLKAWESGDQRPTFAQAQKFASTLKVPLGYLFLPSPPIQKLPITDFRTIADRPLKDPSPDLLDLMNSVLTKQQWFKEYRELEGVEPFQFVGRFAENSPVEAVARDIIQVIDVEGARRGSSYWEDFLRRLCRNAEGAGIMVMRSGIVGNNTHRPLDIEEFRGFAIVDPYAPLVFVNGRDFQGAQIFTLVHELAHIWTGQGGLSKPDYSLVHRDNELTVERLCNRIAAETLVPGQDFQPRWQEVKGGLDEKISQLTRHFRVSRMVILRQAFDHNCISWDVYREQFRILSLPASTARSSGKNDGNYQNSVAARNGIAFTETVIANVAGGMLLHREAAQLLDVKVKNLPTIAKRFLGDGATLG